MSQSNDYQFVMMPQQLSSCLDANCNKMLSTLIGLHSILSKEDGWFYRSNKDLQLDTRLSENVIRATLDTLYRAGIINIDCIGKGKGHRTNRVRINFECFKVYQQYSFNDIRNNPDLWIETVKYKDHFVPSYMRKCEKVSTSITESEDNCESKCEGLCECICEKVSTNTDTPDTSNTKENNILNNLTNKEEEMNILPVEEETPVTQDQVYLYECYFDNPSKDFSCLVDNVERFIQMDYEDLTILQGKLKRNCGCYLSLEKLASILQFVYKVKMGYPVG